MTIAATALISATTAPDANATLDPLPDFDRLWDYNHPEVSEQKFRSLLPIAEKSGDLCYQLQLQTQIARSQGMQGNFQACNTTLDAVEKQLIESVPVARIRYLLERGRALNSSNHPAEAKPLFTDAWQRAIVAKEDRYAIDAAHMIAIVETDLDQQVSWNRNALAIIEQNPAQRGWLSSILNNLGETYRARKEYDKALDCFEKRAQCFLGRGKQPDIFNLKDIARMNRLLNHPDVALSIIEPIAKDLKSKRQPDGYISAEYGQCLVAMKRIDEAKPYLIEAYETLSKDDYMTWYEPDELEHIRQLAGISRH